MASSLRKRLPSDDFFTDSVLDETKIPSPSPSKHKSNPSASKPRRALPNTRTIKGAFEAAAHERRYSASTDDGQPGQENRRPLPARAETVSHPGDYQQSPVTSPFRAVPALSPRPSPSHNHSSPPRGLNDTYQRIAEEEVLNSESMNAEEIEFIQREQSRAAANDGARQDRIQEAPSPLNARGSIRSTPQGSFQVAEANKENHLEGQEDTHVSGMSFVEGLTDPAIRAILTPHTINRARDRARLDRAIQKPIPLAFSKAQIGSRHTPGSNSRSRSGQRDRPTSVDGSLTGSSNASAHSGDSTPPPNVPRGWGSKAKVDKEWLRKIHQRGGGTEPEPTETNPQEPSQVDWTAAAADVPLPSVEQSNRPYENSSRNSTPGRPSQHPTPTERRQWDLTDFTGINLSVSSSPPVKVRTHRHRPSIEKLEKRAVTTNRLVEMRRKESREVLRGTETQDIGTDSKDVETEKGKRIPDTPIIVYKNSTGEDDGASNRPARNIDDSRDSLQRLARTISQSPRLSATLEQWSMVRKEDAEVDELPQDPDTNTEDAPHKSWRDTATVRPTPLFKRSRSADAAVTPVVTGAWTDTILPDTVKTIKQFVPSKYTQTPRITGGWIDTPIGDRQRQTSAFAPEVLVEKPTVPPVEEVMEVEVPEVVAEAPASTLPRSALSNLLTKAKRKMGQTIKGEEEEQESPGTSTRDNDTLNLGDATIASLEDLLTLDNADMTALIQMGAELEAREDLIMVDQRAGDNGKDNKGMVKTESELLDRLGSKLDRLRTNIYDARKGISKLESQVSHPNAQTKSLVKTAKDEPCQRCGCPGARSASSPIYLSIRIPRMYTPAQKPAQTFPRPTPFGYCILTFWTWYIIESLIWNHFRIPEYAEYWSWPLFWDGRGNWLENGMQRYRMQMRFGAMLPIFFRTLFDVIWGGITGGWAGWGMRVVALFIRAVYRAVAMYFGFGDGFVHDKNPSFSVPPIPSTSGGMDMDMDMDTNMGMDGDEYL